MKLSFIIPTLNEEKVIQSTLAKIKKLAAFEYEIIVSDERSSDKTAEFAKKIADRVVVEEKKEKHTIGYGRNRGAALAKGEYLVFMDADVETPDPDNFFKKALLQFEKDPQLVGLSVFLKVLPEMRTFADSLFFGLINYGHLINCNILKKGTASGEFLMLKRAAFQKIGGFREDLPAGEDVDLFRRLSKIGHTKIEPSLHIFHTGRRAHKIGWARLLFTWARDGVYLLLFNKVASKEWKEVR